MCVCVDGPLTEPAASGSEAQRSDQENLDARFLLKTEEIHNLS